MFDVVIIGHVSLDSDTTPYGTRSVLGGAAYYAAMGASRFSRRVGVVTRVGDDYDLANLSKLGIDTSGVRVVQGKTSRFYIDYSRDFSSRTVGIELNVGEQLSVQDFPASYFDARTILVCTAPPRQQRGFIQLLGKRDRSHALAIDSIKQYLENSKPEVVELFYWTDFVFLAEEEYEMVKNATDFRGKSVIVKKGSRGATLLRNHHSISALAPKVKRIVDPTGAGDILDGAFLAQVAAGRDLSMSLKNAVHLATNSITDYGAEHLIK